MAAYHEALKERTNDAFGHAFLGNALRAQGKTEEAVAEYRKAIKLDPGSAFSHDFLGAALRAQDKTDEAVAEYRKAVELDPRSAIAHRYLGFALLDQGKADDAIAEFRKAVEFDPKDSYSVLWLHLARTRSGAHNAAAELETHAKNLKQPDWPMDGLRWQALFWRFERLGRLRSYIRPHMRALASSFNTGLPCKPHIRRDLVLTMVPHSGRESSRRAAPLFEL